MSNDIRKELEDALKADQDKAMAVIEAMDKVYKEIWGEPPEEE